MPLFLLFSAITALLLTSTTALRAAPADELIAMGDTFYAKLQATEALKYYLPAEKLEPNNVRLLEHISREYRHLMCDATSAQEKLSLGNTAVNYARRAVAINPNDPEAQLAVAKLPDSTHEEAAACFQRAIALNPNRLMHYIELGLVYAQMGRTDEARRFINTGLSMPCTEKDDPEVKNQGRDALTKLR